MAGDVSLCDANFVLKLDGTTSPPPPSPPLACQLPSQLYISLLKVLLRRLQHPHLDLICCVIIDVVLTIWSDTIVVINHFHSQLCIYLSWHESLYRHNWHATSQTVCHVLTRHSLSHDTQTHICQLYNRVHLCDITVSSGRLRGDHSSIMTSPANTPVLCVLDWVTSHHNKNNKQERGNTTECPDWTWSISSLRTNLGSERGYL